MNISTYQCPKAATRPENISRIIKEIKRADLSRVDISYLVKIVHLLTKGYAHTSFMLPTGWGKFHRAIKYDHRPSHIGKLSYPPINLANAGRANFANNPVFYCSGNPIATFFELGINPGDTVALSKWNLINEIPVTPIGYTIEIFEHLKANRKCPSIIPDSVRHPREFRKPNIQINNFFYEVFTNVIDSENKFLYRLTAVIAAKFLSINEQCGIAYPSISMHANAENFAFTRAVADHSLNIECVTWYRVDSVKNFTYTVTPLAYADLFDSSGFIEWQPPQSETAFL